MPVEFPGGDPRRKLVRIQQSLRDGAFDACRAAALATVSLAQKTLTDIDAVDRGILRASLGSRVEQTPAGARSQVYAGAQHSKIIEFGRAGTERDPRSNKNLGGNAVMQRVSDIEGWVRRQWKKLAIAGRSKNGRAIRPTERQIKSVAFLITRSIYRRGLKPRPWFTPSFNRIAALFPGMVYEAARRRIARIVGGTP